MALQQTDIDALIAAWQPYCAGIQDWQALVHGVTPKQTGCGPIYELPSPLKDRPNESFAICDMREVTVADPHYHPTENWEFYFVLSGTATVVVGEKERHAKKGDVITIPPDTAHFTIPAHDFVIAAVNNPPFTPGSYITLGASDEARLEVEFDLAQYRRLTAAAPADSAK
jgi:mannose-6-phosphate isomerase-like protein (cupin superfamily)